MVLPIWAIVVGVSRLGNAALKTPAGKRYAGIIAKHGKKKGKQLWNKYVSGNSKVKAEAQKKAKLLDADERSIGLYGKPMETKGIGHTRFNKKLQSDPYPVKQRHGGKVKKKYAHGGTVKKNRSYNFIN